MVQRHGKRKGKKGKVQSRRKRSCEKVKENGEKSRVDEEIR